MAEDYEFDLYFHGHSNSNPVYKQREVMTPQKSDFLRFDLIPREAFNVLADAFTRGLETHEPREFLDNVESEEYIQNRLNHMFNHMLKLIHPQETDDDYSLDYEALITTHLGAIMFGCAFLALCLNHSEKSQTALYKVLDF